MSDYLPCTRRQRVETLGKDGVKGEFQQCAHPLAIHFTKSVSSADCAGCSLRAAFPLPGLLIESPTRPRQFPEPVVEEDGTLRYERASIEPPPAHEGYRRKNEDVGHDDAWAFVPIFEPCLDRQMANSVRPSGCIQINAYCVSQDSGYTKQPVTADICAQCQVRRSEGQVVVQH